MLNDLLAQLRKYRMVQPGEQVICAVSGGADSMALLWAMYLLREKLQIRLSAAHFNHHLRGTESDRDEQFVRNFCDRFEIPLYVGEGVVTAGAKGLEAAARDARYAFLDTLPGKIATAHTADDNAETVLMHLVRGTGLKGLGGIMPVGGRRIRPMLNCTRQQVLSFLEEYHIPFVEDSSNGSDDFLRNRLRHHVMPLLKQENPCFAENVSRMAMELREDEAALSDLAAVDELPPVTELRKLSAPVRSRMLERFLKQNGVKEPEREHILLAESLVFSEKPSASGQFPGNVTVRRNYDRLEVAKAVAAPETVLLPMDGEVLWEAMNLRVCCRQAQEIINSETVFTVRCGGKLTLRSRQSGDEMRLSGGTKSLKKLFIDRKIPAALRQSVPVVVDENGIVGVYGIGADWGRKADSLPAVQIWFESVDSSEKL